MQLLTRVQSFNFCRRSLVNDYGGSTGQVTRQKQIVPRLALRHADYMSFILFYFSCSTLVLGDASILRVPTPQLSPDEPVTWHGLVLLLRIRTGKSRFVAVFVYHKRVRKSEACRVHASLGERRTCRPAGAELEPSNLFPWSSVGREQNAKKRISFQLQNTMHSHLCLLPLLRMLNFSLLLGLMYTTQALCSTSRLDFWWGF